jgi:Tol biopolymer transport system component
MSMFVFARRDGGPLVLLDAAGRKQQLAGAKSAFVPAWSNDGQKIAWLERKDKRKYDLMIAEISAR